MGHDVQPFGKDLRAAFHAFAKGSFFYPSERGENHRDFFLACVTEAFENLVIFPLNRLILEIGGNGAVKFMFDLLKAVAQLIEPRPEFRFVFTDVDHRRLLFLSGSSLRTSLNSRFSFTYLA